MEAGASTGLGQRSEVEQLQVAAHKVTDDSLESTRRMRSLCEESQDTGAKTLVMLSTQGEQLDRIEDGMDQINEDMREAEKNLSGMEKCCGLCILPCGKIKDFRQDDNTWKDKGDGVVTGQPTRVTDGRNGVPAGAMQIARITNDAREDEMEDNLGQVNNMIDNLRNMAIDMGSELDSQNRQISRIDAKAGSNDERIKQANTRANVLIKNA